MRIAILGGTGNLGGQVTEELRLRGHDVRVLSRHSRDYPVDLVSGSGLARALDGCDAVVDATNGAGRAAAATLVDGTTRVLQAEAGIGTPHHVLVSIVGCEAAPMAYFRVKAEQERVVAGGEVPWSIVRATQFHEFVGGMFEQSARRGILPRVHARLQPVSSPEVARLVADVAEAPARRGRTEIAGPRIRDTGELAGLWRSARGSRAVPVPIPLPGALGRALRSGALTQEHPDVRGEGTFEEWLQQRGSAQ